MQSIKLKYLGTEIEPDPEPETELELPSGDKSLEEIAAEWRDTQEEYIVDAGEIDAGSDAEESGDN